MALSDPSTRISFFQARWRWLGMPRWVGQSALELARALRKVPRMALYTSIGAYHNERLGILCDIGCPSLVIAHMLLL
jgi:hypothetical protein